MARKALLSRTAMAACAIAVAALCVGSTGAVAQQLPPKDLNSLPAPSTAYTPKKTPWGDWDFRGTWPIDNIASAHILFERPLQFGSRNWVTPEEFAKRLAAAKRSDASFSTGTNSNGQATSTNAGGTEGLVKWMETDPFAHRTSMLVSNNGQLPPLTEWGHKLWAEGRSSWVPNQNFNWVDDFDSWDDCYSRGFPASMFPFRYNNGIRIFQSPGYIVIELEMLGTRVIPISNSAHWPHPVEAWMGNSRAHWEGKTLVIETTNIKSGDAATHDASKRAASPLNMATANVPPFNTIPTSDEAHTTERLTMIGPNTITYEITYDDPKVFTAPWTARIDWSRNDKYQFFEYACFEGDVQVRNYISASHAKREQIAEGKLTGKEPDGNARFAHQFDFDPATMPETPPGPPGGGPGRRVFTPPPPGAYSADGKSPSWDRDAPAPPPGATHN
ncbi:MAG TPA: hypothetical protein VMU37_02075 [Caulobacteraceae bacterium]|nr:hypothetical protein [Caulobacteraceae bacterium]